MNDARIRGLCIGGVADGRWIENDTPHLSVAKPPQPPLWPLPEGAQMATLIVDHYLAERFVVEDARRKDKTTWWLWRLHDMSMVECIDRLFRGYRGSN